MAHPVSPAPRAEPPLPASGWLASDRNRLELLDRLEERLRDFVDFVPRFRVRRAFFDGAWVLGAHTGGLAGQSSLPFSRLDLEVRFADDGRQLALVSRSTVRGRDLERRELEDVPGDDPRVARFVEEAVLAFADRYFDRS